jgi:hypothetical protein
MSEQNLIANNLIYQVPASSTAAIQRQYRQSYFDQRKYASQRTMRCVWNTGNNYVNMATSALVLKVKAEFDGTQLVVGDNTGSIYNLIKNIRVFSKSGVELCNILNANVNRVIEDKCTKSKDWHEVVGELMGYTGVTAVWNTSGAVQEYVIPLTLLATVFDCKGKQLMPSALGSGLVVEIDGENPNIAFKRMGDGTFQDYTIEDIYFNLDCVTLSDNTVGTLNEITGKQLLQWTYCDVYNSRITQNAGNSILSTSINRSVGFADHIASLIQNQSRVNSATEDSFLAPYSDAAGSYQYTLGSVQLPSNQEVAGETQTRFQTISTYSKLQEESDLLSIFTKSQNEKVAPKTCSFSRDQKMALSQIPVSSARSLRLECNFDSAPAEAQVCNIFLHYIKVLEISLTDVKVSY